MDKDCYYWLLATMYIGCEPVIQHVGVTEDLPSRPTPCPHSQRKHHTNEEATVIKKYHPDKTFKRKTNHLT